MGDVVKSEGLVIAVTDTSGNVYPFACTKDATINISRDFWNWLLEQTAFLENIWQIGQVLLYLDLV